LTLLSLLLLSNVYAYNYDDGKHIADKSYREAINKLNAMKSPQALMGKIYKGIPPEAKLKPSLEQDVLKRLGASKLNTTVIGNLLSQQAKTRLSQKANQTDSDEVQLSKSAMEHAYIMTHGGCYTKSSACVTKTNLMQCIDEVGYQKDKALFELTVKLGVLNQKTRAYQSLWRPYYQPISINLSACGNNEYNCNKSALVQIAKDCKKIKVSVKPLYSSQSSQIQVTKHPSCTSPVIEFYDNSFGWNKSYSIDVEQYGLIDTWETISRPTSAHGQCYATGENVCLVKNVSKNISNIKVTRACWRRQENYQCMTSMKGSCAPLIRQGCNQVKSECLSSITGLCDKYNQTFQCSKTTCNKENKICFKPVDCADGSCQIEAQKKATKKEMGDGLVNLAALANSADNIKKQNLSQASLVNIFSATNYTCRKDGFDIGNCCVDRAREFARCKEEGEKAISTAKAKGLAVYVGTYEDGWLGFKKRESWCVFNSRMGFLIRVMGGLNQLGLGFGEARDDYNAANCNGLTPEQLSHIDLGKIDFGELEEEVKALFKAPSGHSQVSGNTSHIKDLARKGHAHDS
jgi:conjugal transfer mating pair stabilization protein TraN